MNYGLYLSAASLHLNEQRQAVLANNLANVNTVGFKEDLAVIRARRAVPQELNLPLSDAFPLLDRMAGGLASGGSHVDFSQGSLQSTGWKYDLALDGEGFFAVQADGERRFTRDGRLTTDSEGYLVTQAGHHKLLDSSGQPIRLPAGEPAIDEDGTIRVADTAVRLGVVRFDDPSALLKAGANTYVLAGPAMEQPTLARVRQGFIETSGVEPTTMLVDMLTVQRAYDASAQMIRQADAMLARAVNDIARIA